VLVADSSAGSQDDIRVLESILQIEVSEPILTEPMDKTGTESNLNCLRLSLVRTGRIEPATIWEFDLTPSRCTSGNERITRI
jgi:hypothetical protein